ncbi:MAG: shikimate dehydrogenase [Anaerolineales bacterium]
MIHLGLVGYPLEHSLSPKIHSAALKLSGLRGDYSLFPISPDDKQGLEDLLARVRSGEITGLNVTIPHKQNVISCLDELTSTAKAIGAVNTIYCHNNKLVGDNTDADGFLLDLRRFTGNRESKIVNRKVALILGAGGSARAVIYALLNHGWNVVVTARRMEQAQQLAMSFPQRELSIMNYKTFDVEPSIFNLIVNTMPLGMTPNINQSPWPDDLPYPHQAMIYDLVYDPRETKLVKDACAAGLSATTGLGMLIEQATLSFEIWTGHKPSRETLLESIIHDP